MAIQFRCPGCAQPIEVDDIHAGQTATCPYCRRVVTVPAESVLDERPVTARPAGGRGAVEAPNPAASRAPGSAPPPIPESTPAGLHVGPVLSHRERGARTFGNYALICTALALLLLATVIVASFTLIAPTLAHSPGSQPTQEQLAQMSAQLEANPWIGAVTMGAGFFALAGLALGITSLAQSRRSNWRGVVSVVLCGGTLLCFCSSALLSVAGGVGV